MSVFTPPSVAIYYTHDRDALIQFVLHAHYIPVTVIQGQLLFIVVTGTVYTIQLQVLSKMGMWKCS